MNRPVTEGLLSLIRPEVRSERAYIVPGARPVSVKLNQNESPFDLPPELKRQLLEEFFEISFNRYPSEQPTKLLEALESHCKVEPGSILAGNGSNELTYTIGMCFVSKGDEVLIPCPTFALYDSMVRLHGGTPLQVTCRADHQINTEAIISTIRDRQPKLVVLATPNNPTGRAIPLEDIRKIVQAAPGFVVVDEAYHEFNPEPSALTLQSEFPNVIILRTLSKAFGLAGLRLGYLVARPEVTAQIMKARLPFMIDRLSEQVALMLLDNDTLVSERVSTIMNNTRDLATSMRQVPGLEVRSTDTNFVLFKADSDAAKLLERLADLDVLVRNMGGYPELKGFLRVTSGTKDENKVFLAALTSVVGKKGQSLNS